MEKTFENFLNTVDENYQPFVRDINEYLLNNNCKSEIKIAKSGYQVSYILVTDGKTLATFITRKSGLKIRILPRKVDENLLKEFPDKMKKDIKKASVCKRLIDPNSCNPKCVMGYKFNLDNVEYKKCRYMAFLISLSKENNPYIRMLLDNELI